MQFDEEIGLQVVSRMQEPSVTEEWRALMDGLSRGSDAWILGAVFGGTYQHTDLTADLRQVATISALVSQGGVDRELLGHFRTSLRLGVPPRLLGDVLVHLLAYVGAPRALAAMRLLRQALDERAE